MGFSEEETFSPGVNFSFKELSGDCGKGEFFLKDVPKELKPHVVCPHDARILESGLSLRTGLNAEEACWLIEGGMEGPQC